MTALRTTLAALAFAALGWVPTAGASDAEGRIARGRYLTHEVAMCVQCHTPRRHDGTLIETRLFEGAPVPFPEAPFPTMRWALQAPSIAGLPGFTDEEEITLLTTGSRPSGRTPDPPMPPFRFSRADAEAIVAYLRSLRPRPVP